MAFPKGRKGKRDLFFCNFWACQRPFFQWGERRTPIILNACAPGFPDLFLESQAAGAPDLEEKHDEGV
jgi:hypothetical protein